MFHFSKTIMHTTHLGFFNKHLFITSRWKGSVSVLGVLGKKNNIFDFVTYS